MSRLIFNVYEQQLTVSASSPIVANSYNSVSGIYNIASGWSYLSSIIAYFQLKDESAPVNFRVILTENGDFPTASNLNFTAGTWQSWLVGEEFDEEGKLKRRITTNIVEFDVEESGIPSGIPFVIEPPSIGEQILGIANAALAKATEVENKANAGAFNGTNGKDGASAGWGAVTASVDDKTGKPYVIVTSSGSNTAKDINFEFHNLKGGGGAVDSVNGKTGAVVLTAEDVGALAKNADIDMNEHNIHNVGEIDLTFLSVGAIIGNTEKARITGTSDGKAAVVKDNTQSEYVQMRVGYPSDENDAATKKYVLDIFNSIANGNEVLY